MTFYPSAKDLNIVDCTLESSKLFIFTKCELHLPPGANCHLHCPNNRIYSIHSPDTQATRQYTQDLLSLAEHGVAHITSLLEIDYPSSQQHIARLAPAQSNTCWAIQTNIGTLCNAKRGIHAPSYKGMKRSFSPSRVWSKGLAFAQMTLHIV